MSIVLAYFVLVERAGDVPTSDGICHAPGCALRCWLWAGRWKREARPEAIEREDAAPPRRRKLRARVRQRGWRPTGPRPLTLEQPHLGTRAADTSGHSGTPRVVPAMSCSISQNDATLGERAAHSGCGHLFHIQCVVVWVATSAEGQVPGFPQCRMPVEVVSREEFVPPPSSASPQAHRPSFPWSSANSETAPGAPGLEASENRRISMHRPAEVLTMFRDPLPIVTDRTLVLRKLHDLKPRRPTAGQHRLGNHNNVGAQGGFCPGRCALEPGRAHAQHVWLAQTQGVHFVRNVFIWMFVRAVAGEVHVQVGWCSDFAFAFGLGLGNQSSTRQLQIPASGLRVLVARIRRPVSVGCFGGPTRGKDNGNSGPKSEGSPQTSAGTRLTKLGFGQYTL